MEEKFLITLLTFAIIVPFALLLFFSIKKIATEWYYRGLRLATGYYTNKKVINKVENREYIQYNNHISRWLYTYLFPTIYKILVVLIPVVLLCVRIPNGNGYILKSDDYTKVAVVAVLDTDSFNIRTENLMFNADTQTYSLPANIDGIVLGEYIEKDITIYTIPGIIVRSVSASVRVFINKGAQLIEKIY